MEAKKQGVGEEDLSMEEILQSIRRIIADDGEGDKSKTTASVTDDIGVAANSDILELTDMIEDDGSITNIKESTTRIVDSIDVLSNIDAALTQESPILPKAAPEITTPITTPLPEPPLPPITSLQSETKSDSVKPNKIVEDGLGALLSKTAEEAALSSLSKLTNTNTRPIHQPTPSPVFRSGSTVEDMVEDLLKPMMKEWLDNNLPDIVEKIVENEVLRLSRR